MFKASIWLLFALSLASLFVAPFAISGEKSESNTINGCICEVNETENIIKVIPWEKEIKLWDIKDADWFYYENNTSISAKNNLTISDLKAGKAIQTFHFLGIKGGKLTGEPFEINEVSGLIGRRATIRWVERTGKKISETISLPYLFGGETMPAYVGAEGASLSGIDNCPCK